MSELLVNTIKKADGTGNIAIPAESGTVVTTASPSLGRRNLIINGAMQVAQRGTSATGLGNGNSGYHTVDRVKLGESATPAAEFTMSQDTDAPDGFQNSLKMACTTAESSPGANNAIRLEFKMEGQDLKQLAYGSASAKTITLSFWVKSSQTGVAAMSIYCPDGVRQNTLNYTINSADTWEYKTISIIGDTSNTFTNTNTESMRLEFSLMAGANLKTGTVDLNSWNNYSSTNRALNQTVNVAASTSDYWQITGVQLEVGSVATPFEHRSYGEELALCQRYYQKYGADTIYTRFAVGFAASASAMRCYMHFITPLRSAPTMTNSGNFAAYHAAGVHSASSLSYSYQTVNGAAIDATASSMTTNESIMLLANNDSSAYIAVDAEL